MKYFGAIFLSALCLLYVVRPIIGADFWHIIRHGKGYFTKEEKRKEYKISIIIWAIFTIALLIVVVFFAK